jgi:hypothetical protein
MTILIALDGVLRAATGNPIPEGRILFEVLKACAPVVVLSDKPSPEGERWLKVNNVAYDNLIGAEVNLDTSVPLRRQQVSQERAKSSKIEFLVDSNADHVWWAVSEGIPALFFAHPQFAAPVSRRDSNKGRRSWDEIQTEIDRRQAVALDEEAEEPDDADL